MAVTHAVVTPAELAQRASEGQAHRLSPADVDKQMDEILGEQVDGLAAEAEQLTRAHAVLHRALQDNEG